MFTFRCCCLSLGELLGAAQVIELYCNHATHEQFHSEFKTDMDLERLPSGKFDTNYLVCQLAAVAMNLLRLIGQNTLNEPAARAAIGFDLDGGIPVDEVHPQMPTVENRCAQGADHLDALGTAGVMRGGGHQAARCALQGQDHNMFLSDAIIVQATISFFEAQPFNR